MFKDAMNFILRTVAIIFYYYDLPNPVFRVSAIFVFSLLRAACNDVIFFATFIYCGVH